MNKWFVSVFLPSLFERAKGDGPERRLRLSERQIDVCRRYMDKHEHGFRDIWFTWDCRWNGRRVCLQNYSLVFCPTEDEASKYWRERELQKLRDNLTRWSDRASDGSDLAKKLIAKTEDDLNNRIAYCLEMLGDPEETEAQAEEDWLALEKASEELDLFNSIIHAL